LSSPLQQALSRKLEINGGIMSRNNTVEKFAKTILQTSLNKRKNNTVGFLQVVIYVFN